MRLSYYSLQILGAPRYDLAVGNRCQLTECDDGLCTPNPFMSVERQKQDHE